MNTFNHVISLLCSVCCDWDYVKPSNHLNGDEPPLVCCTAAALKSTECGNLAKKFAGVRFARNGGMPDLQSWGQNMVYPYNHMYYASH